MNARAIQRFVRVDVPDAAQKSLVEQQSFDLSFVRANARLEVFEGDFQRLRSQLTHARGQSRAQLQAAELAAVVVQERSAIESQNGMRMLSGGAIHKQLAGHP